VVPAEVRVAKHVDVLPPANTPAAAAAAAAGIRTTHVAAAAADAGIRTTHVAAADTINAVDEGLRRCSHIFRLTLEAALSAN
jgi:hypothetical protein